MLDALARRYKTFCDMIAPPEPRPELWDSFYNEFENRFRGSREAIASRLETRYRKLVKKQARNCQSKIAIDVGCGRCEFLDLTKQEGFMTHGSEVSPELVRQARHAGHDVVRADAVRYLKSQASSSAGIIASFHVVEHCDSAYNFAFFEQANRVLMENGVLIIETPSLLSLFAGHRQFYLDPTHKNPIHPELLRFMAEKAGFRDAELLQFDPVEGSDRAQLSQALSDKKAKEEARKLENWLYGPMDIALIAYK